MNMNLAPSRMAAALLAATLIGAPLAAHADEREDLEKLRATVLGLIDTLVKSGVIPADKADAMMREAEVRATERLAQMPAAPLGPDGKKIVRVAYVPDAVKVQMRDQIKAEVLAETRAQGAQTASAADSRFKLEGDLRLRVETTRLDPGNSSVATISAGNKLTRAADMWNTASNGGLTANTKENTTRERLRARLGVTAAIADTVSAGVAISTGSTTGSPTSTNQTIGQGNSQSPGFFNKYSLALDRAYLKYDPAPWLSMSGGRFRNPFFGTDLVWADDLNFEGVAMSFKPKLSPASSVFLTAGWFPLTTSVPNQVHGRSLLAMQAGFDWQIGQKENRIKMAAAIYDYKGIEGVAETTASFNASLPDYGVRSSYTSGQRGNTLFLLNAPGTSTATPYWGLASAFRELDLTATVDVAQFDPLHVLLTGDVVKNLGFKRGEVNGRIAGSNSGALGSLLDGHSLGYMGKIQVGAPQITKRGDWNVSLAYRYLGSDAVLDAFTNSDFGLGGTNTKGTILGMNYGIATNTWLSARWLSSDLIDSIVPSTSTSSVPTKYSVDLLQLDLNTKF